MGLRYCRGRAGRRRRRRRRQGVAQAKDEGLSRGSICEADAKGCRIEGVKAGVGVEPHEVAAGREVV